MLLGSSTVLVVLTAIKKLRAESSSRAMVDTSSVAVPCFVAAFSLQRFLNFLSFEAGFSEFGCLSFLSFSWFTRRDH